MIRCSRRTEGTYINGFIVGQQQQQFWFNYQQQLMQLRQRRLLAAILLQRQQRAIDILDITQAHRERPRNDPSLGWPTARDGQRQLDWFVPQHRPDDGLGVEDHTFRTFMAGFIPQRGAIEPLQLPEDEQPLRRSSEDLPFPPGGRIRSDAAGSRNPFGL